MKKFSLKDFVLYNSPCFSCDNLMTFQIGNVMLDNDIVTYLAPKVCKEYTTIELRLGWDNNLILTIDHKTNKFATNDSSALAKYLLSHNLFLKCECDKCHTVSWTEKLSFSSQGFVRAVSLDTDIVNIGADGNIYNLYCEYQNNISQFFISKNDRSTSPFVLNTILVPRSKFKNRAQLIAKMKTYALFS